MGLGVRLGRDAPNTSFIADIRRPDLVKRSADISVLSVSFARNVHRRNVARPFRSISRLPNRLRIVKIAFALGKQKNVLVTASWLVNNDLRLWFNSDFPTIGL